MPFKEHKPERKKKIVTNADPQDEILANQIDDWVEDSEAWVSTWESNQEKWHKLRMRIKKTKTFPFPGCANIRMPTIETKLKKLKSAILNVLIGIRPIVQAVPNPTGNWQDARKLEKYLDHLVMDKIKIKPKLVILVDQSLEKGFILAKPFYRREVTTRVETLSLDDITLEEAVFIFDPERTLDELYQDIAQRLEIDTSSWVLKENIAEVQRVTEEILSGKEKVRFTLKDVIYNAPDVAIRPPENIYVPTTSGYDPQMTSYIIDEFFLPLRTVKSYAQDKGWNAEAIGKVEAIANVDLDENSAQMAKDDREGIERLQSTDELVAIQEAYAWYDINGDDVEEKCVVTVASDFGLVLRKITNPFHSGKIPYVKFFYELTDDRWFSHRGLAEIIEDIVKEIDIQHMQKIDYGTLVNSPMFMFRAGQVGESTTQFLFGQGIPVQGMQDLRDILQPINAHNPNVELSYEREQLLLETKVEELIGQIDTSLHSIINRREPRTATEVQQQSQSMNQVFSLDADLYRESFTELINWIWELDNQFGDDEIKFSYFGPEGFENIKMSREEIQGKYRITLRGNDQNTNPVIRQNKASFVLQDTYQAFQLGLAGPQAVMAARARAYQELEVEGWEQFVQPPPPATPPDEVKIKMEDLTEAEQALVLQKRGIKPDIDGRQERNTERKDDREMDDLLSVAEVLNKGTGGGNGSRN